MSQGPDSVFFDGVTNLPQDGLVAFGVKGLMESNADVKEAVLFHLLSYISDQLLVQRYSTAEEILKASTTVIDIEDLEYIDHQGVGVYRKKDGQLGIRTEEGAVTATRDGGISENPLNPADWDTSFLFPGVEYGNISNGSFVTIHAIVHSSTYTTANGLLHKIKVKCNNDYIPEEPIERA